MGGTLGAHNRPGTWYSPTCGVLALPQVDLPAMPASARVIVPWHPNASLGQHDRLAAARDFALLLHLHVHA